MKQRERHGKLLRAAACNLAVLAVFGLLYGVLRLPGRGLELQYYDDAEALYHTLSVLCGRLPYRDDHSHHFLGYVLEYLLAARIFGFSLDLVRQTAFLNQAAMAFVLYLCALRYMSRPRALLAGALAISAREPWVRGFYIQYQLSLGIVVLLYFCLRYLARRNPLALAAAGAAAGLLFTFDQRALVLGIVPLAAALLAGPPFGRPLLFAAAAMLLAPAAAAAYLTYHALWPEFIAQTFVFPGSYRMASQSAWEVLRQGLLLHRHLIWLTPILTVTALLGFVVALKRRADSRFGLLVILALPLAVMPFFGARDFDYYTVTWLPYAALLSALSCDYFVRLPRRAQAAYCFALCMPVLLALFSALLHAGWQADLGYRGDGAQELAAYLEREVGPDESLYVWGYRPDIYVRLGRTSPYPFVNQMMIHPDSSIQDEEQRRRHVFPEYEADFLRRLAGEPPDWVVTFNEENARPSRAHSAVKQLLERDYRRTYESDRQDFTGNRVLFRAYRRS